MAARAVRTDAERAADELKVYEARLARVTKARDAARSAYEAAQAEYEAVLAVRNHVRSNPALRELDDDDVVSLGAHPGEVAV